MTGKFYIISIGPGNPELITIQALKTLQACDTIFVQTRSKELTWEGSVAHKILTNIQQTYSEWFNSPTNTLDFIKEWDKKLYPLYSPMNYCSESWTEQVKLIIDTVKSGKKAGFVTLGDAGIYSSAYYLLEIIKEKNPKILENVEIIAGISSISYASSLVKKPLCLGDAKLEVIPVHEENLNTTTVYMRPHKGDNLKNKINGNFYHFQNLGLENQAFGEGIPDTIDKYLTILIDFAEIKPSTCPTKSENK